MRTSFGFWIVVGALVLAGAAVAASPSVGVAEGVSTSATPAAVQRANFNNTGIRDEAAMVLVGTILIGLAGAVRRAA